MTKKTRQKIWSDENFVNVEKGHRVKVIRPNGQTIDYSDVPYPSKMSFSKEEKMEIIFNPDTIDEEKYVVQFGQVQKVFGHIGMIYS